MSPNVLGGLTPRRRPRGRAAAALLPGVFALLLAGVSGAAAATPTATSDDRGKPRRSQRHSLTDSAHVLDNAPTGNVSFYLDGPSDPTCANNRAPDSVAAEVDCHA